MIRNGAFYTALVAMLVEIPVSYAMDKDYDRKATRLDMTIKFKLC